MKNFIVRTITGVFFVAAIVVSFLNPMAMVFLFALITGMTIWEFCGLVNERPYVQVNQFISTVAGMYLFLAMAGHCSGYVNTDTVFIPYLITIIYLLIAELFLKAKDPVNNWAYTMFPQLYIALPFSMLNVLAFNKTADNQIVYNTLLPLSIFVFLWINDTGAYLCGSLLGRHKLFPRVSPGKSWEGSVGGAVFVLLCAFVISRFVDKEGMFAMQVWMGLGLTVVVFGTLGDLVESLFKRTLGIKDSGNILPGHGGMLDRFDSSLLAIPAAVVYLFTISLM